MSISVLSALKTLRVKHKVEPCYMLIVAPLCSLFIRRLCESAIFI